MNVIVSGHKNHADFLLLTIAAGPDELDTCRVCEVVLGERSVMNVIVCVCVHAEGECSVASGVYMWRMYRQSIIIALEEPLAVQNQSDSAVCRSMRPIRVCFV